ncbi:F1F0 ATP synthase subunit e ASCRUDRAFT_74018 [Ascoidea rubescens DSM 1968]|uniref:ATP synthase F(0) complex subunit e, mitochondrial n=1 Tax=Ascoidea rubescens DSM 1968 TaxID=1344418 RepID=A0A1D2VRZ9_9ASCO|nr:hypothetical protein ASCRUDRAFT_74018 [Ascoidea rubescens DSM 1968]ODV64381.1 hypothetical protein ASCRUDRAFT_74018 [Ascoidea rubescens DSM 1968]
MSTLSVLRYSVLGAGILYGFTHDRSLQNTAAKSKADHDYAKQEKLIQQAKDAYIKSKQQPLQSTAQSPQLSNINLDDPKADFAQLILSSVESLK